MNSFLLIAGGECHGQKACLKNDNSHQIPARVVLICPHCNTPCRPSIHQGQYILPTGVQVLNATFRVQSR